MSFCKIHPDRQLVAKGDQMVCPKEECGYGYTVPKRLPSYNELKEKVEELEAEVAYLKELIKTLSNQRA